MIRDRVIAAAAVLALGTVAMTDASAQGMREHGGRGGASIGASGKVGAEGSGGGSRMSTNLRTSGSLANTRSTRGNVRSDVGFASTRSSTLRASTTGVARTGWSGQWDRGDWRRHRFGGGWGPSFGVGFAAADYGYDWGPDYGYPGYGYADLGYGASVGYGASYGGCNCGYPGYAYDYGYDYPGYAYAAPVGFGVGFGFSGRPFHRHW